MKLDKNKLLQARERLGYSLETVGEKAGTSKNSVLRAEHEEDIRPLTARKIAEALGVEVAELIREPTAPKAESPSRSLSPEAETTGAGLEDAVDELITLPVDEQRLILAAVSRYGLPALPEPELSDELPLKAARDFAERRLNELGLSPGRAREALLQANPLLAGEVAHWHEDVQKKFERARKKRTTADEDAREEETA